MVFSDMHKSRDIDKELLISEVQSRPELWRADDPAHNNKELTNPLWDEVAAACGVKTVAETKSAWKSLKDTYRKILRKAAKDVKPPKWKFVEQMEFVKPYLMTLSELQEDIQMNQYLTLESKEEIHAISGNSEDTFKFRKIQRNNNPPPKVDCSNGEGDESTNHLSSVESSCSSVQNHKRKSYDADLEFLNLEREKLRILKRELANTEEDNPDMNFFKSILPYMEEFTPLEKLKVMSDIQNVVLTHYSKKVEKEEHFDICE